MKDEDPIARVLAVVAFIACLIMVYILAGMLAEKRPAPWPTHHYQRSA